MSTKLTLDEFTCQVIKFVYGGGKARPRRSAADLEIWLMDTLHAVVSERPSGLRIDIPATPPVP